MYLPVAGMEGRWEGGRDRYVGLVGPKGVRIAVLQLGVSKRVSDCHIRVAMLPACLPVATNPGSDFLSV